MYKSNHGKLVRDRGVGCGTPYEKKDVQTQTEGESEGSYSRKRKNVSMRFYKRKYKGRVYFKPGYPVGLFLGEWENIWQNFKGCLTFAENLRGCENFHKIIKS